MKCLYPDRRLCPLCTTRTRRIRIDGARTTASPRPSVTWCWECGTPMAQEQRGAPRLYCSACRASRDRASARAARAERAGAAT